MLGEFLDDHPMINMLKGTVDCPFPSANDLAWQTLPKAVLAELKTLAAEYRSQPYPVLTATQFMAFVRDGSRKAYEDPYFFRRGKLIAAFLGCCTGDAADVDQVIDGLWCICEETSWVISAHNGSSHEGMRPAKERPLPDINNPYIDLFAAQTSMILSLIVRMMGDELDEVTPLIRRRVEQEIERRIFIPFMTRDDYWWMGFIRKDLCNWTPWIVSNVMLSAALMISDRLRLSELLERACRMLDRWLTVMPEDGGCDEGAGYWNMAGGALLDCLELLEHVTDGRMTFWNDDKLRNIVSFPARAQLGNGWFLNFADCDARPYISGERLQYAGERIHDPALLVLGMSMRREAGLQLKDTPQLWRLLNELFHLQAEASDAEVRPKDVYLPDLQVRVLEKNGCVLAAHGGSNNENHNHNDVGSFMLYVDGEPAVVDAGNMVYTAKTFSDQRYELWNVRSGYHNVPMIGDCEQHNGEQYRADKAVCCADGMTMDFARAYPVEAGVKTCHRELHLTEDGTLNLKDEIALTDAQPVTWVFMLRSQPIPDGPTVLAGSVCLSGIEGMQISVEEIVIDDARMAQNYPGSLWRLTCTDAAATAHHAAFILRRNDV